MLQERQDIRVFYETQVHEKKERDKQRRNIEKNTISSTFIDDVFTKHFYHFKGRSKPTI